MNPYLATALDLGPTVIERILARIPGSSLDESSTEGRFTPREVIAHLADWEPIMRERIVQACAKPGSVIVVFDEGEMAVAGNYAGTDPFEQFLQFQRERRLTCEAVRRVRSEDWAKTAHHPERGDLSAADLANLLIGHDLYHIEQLTAHLPEVSS